MGLLDTIFGQPGSDQSQAMGLLAAGLLKGDFGGGLLAANQVFSPENRLRAQLGQLQLTQAQMGLDRAKREAADDDQVRAAAQRAYVSPEDAIGRSTGPMPDGSAVPQVQPGFDSRAFMGQLWGTAPTRALQYEQAFAKESPYGKVDPKDYTPESVRAFAAAGGKDFSLLQPRTKMENVNGVFVNPYNVAPGTVLPDPNKPFGFNPQGGIVPNTQYQQYELGKARAGATNVSVNTEKSFLSNIGEGFGKGITDAKTQAQAALNTINTVNRLNDALDSGKVLAGPGTTFRQFGLQVGQTLGINGKDAKEQLLNTRQAVQSLAQLELDAAQQMKGQGQITEAERAIIRRAASGDIDGMTPPELRLLSGVLDKTARFKIRNYNQQVAPVKNMPNAAPLAPFLDVQEPPQRQAPGVLRFDASGNLIQN
jgi:hypothetical protein